MTNQNGEFISRKQRIEETSKKAGIKGKFKKFGYAGLATLMFATGAGASALLVSYDDAKLDNVMQAINEYVGNAEQTQEEMQTEIDGLNASILEKDGIIASKQETIDANAIEIQNKTDRIAELEIQLENAIQNGDENANELQSQIDSLTQEKLDLENANASLQSQLDAMTLERDNLQIELDEMTAKYEDAIDNQELLVAELQRANSETSLFENEALTALGKQATNPDDVGNVGDENADVGTEAEPGEEANAGGNGEQVETVTGAMLKETYEANATNYSGTMQQTINEGSAYTYKNNLIVNHSGTAYVVNANGEIVAQQELTENSNGKKSVKIKVAYASGPMTVTDGASGATIYTIQ